MFSRAVALAYVSVALAGFAAAAPNGGHPTTYTTISNGHTTTVTTTVTDSTTATVTKPITTTVVVTTTYPVTTTVPVTTTYPVTITVPTTVVGSTTITKPVTTTVVVTSTYPVTTTVPVTSTYPVTITLPGTTPPPVSTTVTVTAPPTTTTAPASQCNTGSLQCCNSVQSASSGAVGLLLGLLGVVLQDLTVLVGITCSPLSVIGVGGNSCSAQPVCCENNSFNGIIAIGCTPININL